MNLNYTFNKAPLIQNSFEKLPSGSVEPSGWLKSQLEIQSNGLTGILEEVWDDVGENSGWLGGSGENWERGPYYLDGLVPLAYILKDEHLINKAKKWIEWTINSQRQDGFYGPKNNPDWWPRMVMNKVLVQYQEATQDVRIVPFMLKYYRYMLDNIEASPLHTWGKARAADEIGNIYWLYNRTEEKYLLELSSRLYDQSMKWGDFLSDLPYKSSMKGYFDFNYFLKFGWRNVVDNKELTNIEAQHLADTFFFSHVVNVAMGIKHPTVFYQQNEDKKLKAAHRLGIESLCKYHGTANGMFTGDEHLSGNNPSQGTELCAVVEYMYSLENIIRIFGEADMGDILEKVSYNALPATIAKDFLSHQYDQQCNQIKCTIDKRKWFNNNDDSNIFGLQPNFGCCTANMHQGWPKLAQNLWMATEDGGTAAVAYAPCRVNILVGNGIKAQLDVCTDYPFKDVVSINVKLEEPGEFPIMLRIPKWSRKTRIWINEGEQYGTNPGQYFRINRVWNDGDTIQIKFDMDINFTKWYRNSTAVEMGPLVYSLRIKEEWNKIKDNKGFCSDWEIKAKSNWNYALTPDKSLFYTTYNDIDSVPFSTEHPPVVLKAKGKKLGEWIEVDNSAGNIPLINGEIPGEYEDMELIPYGCTTLRITQFPSEGSEKL